MTRRSHDRRLDKLEGRTAASPARPGPFVIVDHVVPSDWAPENADFAPKDRQVLSRLVCGFNEAGDWVSRREVPAEGYEDCTDAADIEEWREADSGGSYRD